MGTFWDIPGHGGNYNSGAYSSTTTCGDTVTAGTASNNQSPYNSDDIHFAT
jgi:hypothetical protein